MGFNSINLKSKKWLLLILCVAIVYCLFEAEGEGDFFIFICAAGKLISHGNIYELKYLDGYNYFYSVLFAIVLKLFYFFPFFWVKFFWLLLNLYLYFKMFLLLSQLQIVNKLSIKHKTYFLTAVFLFSLRFFHENIHSSQITILILWCCIYGLYYIQQSKNLSGSALLALGINIKLLPIVFLPYLVYRGHFKAFALTLFFYLISLFLPSLFIGFDYNLDLLKTWLGLVNPTNELHVLDVSERSFHGLSTLLTTLFIKNAPDPYALHIPRNLFDVSVQSLSLILTTVRLILIAFTLYFLRWPPFKSATSEWKRLTEISYILLVIPLLFPHQQHYAFLFIVPAFCCVLLYTFCNYKSFDKKQKNFLIIAISCIYLTSNLKILLGEYNYYYEHFKILTYGALSLIPLLAWVSSKKNAIAN